MLSNNEVYELITKWTSKNRPFFISRFGDGEGLFAFWEWNYPKYYRKACMKHWGEIPPKAIQKTISDNILNTYLNCDIAGLPYNMEGKLWKKTLASFLNYSPPGLSCSMEIHIDLIRSGFIDQLIKSKRIFYIASRDIDKFLYENEASKVNKILISPQYKFEKTKPKIKFFNQVKSIEQQVEKLDLTEWICLLGVGVAGKHLGILMRSRGGMVIDLGSVFDLWAGIDSRGWIKKYKLFDDMTTQERLANWLAAKKQDYKTGVQLFIDLNIDIKKIPFLQSGSGRIQQTILTRQLEQYARVKNIKPKKYKERPALKVKREKLKSQQPPKAVSGSSNKPIYQRPLIDINPSVKFDKLPVELQKLFKENSSMSNEMKTLHAELKNIQDDPSKEKRRKELARGIVERQKKTRTNWEIIDKWWNSRNDKVVSDKSPEQKAAEEAIKKDRRIKANLNYLRRYKDTDKERQKKELAKRMKELDQWGVNYEELIK